MQCKTLQFKCCIRYLSVFRTDTRNRCQSTKVKLCKRDCNRCTSSAQPHSMIIKHTDKWRIRETEATRKRTTLKSSSNVNLLIREIIPACNISHLNYNNVPKHESFNVQGVASFTINVSISLINEKYQRMSAAFPLTHMSDSAQICGRRRTGCARPSVFSFGPAVYQPETCHIFTHFALPALTRQMTEVRRSNIAWIIFLRYFDVHFGLVSLRLIKLILRLKQGSPFP